jgi:hypothetical protein
MASSDVHQQIRDWYAGFHVYLETQPEFAPLCRIFAEAAGGDLDFNSFRALHQKAIFAIGTKLNSQARDLVVRAIKGYVTSRLGIVIGELAEAEKQSEIIVRLDKMGYRGHVHLPPVGADVVGDMRDYLSASPITVEREGRVDTVTLDEARAHGLAYYSPSTALSCPHLAAIGTDPEILSLVSQYLGAPPTILTYAAWWSFAGYGKPQGSQFFHVDRDDYKFCKLFVYLTDVDMTGGPHSYMDGTQDFDALARLRAQWPGGGDAFEDWFFGSLRKSDREIVSVFQQMPTTFTGKAGTCFLVDTSGIHKGLLPETSDRLIVQLSYGVTPMLASEYLKQKWEVMPMEQVHRGARAKGDERAFDYANRLYLKA